MNYESNTLTSKESERYFHSKILKKEILDATYLVNAENYGSMNLFGLEKLKGQENFCLH